MRLLLTLWMLAIATPAVAFPVQRCMNLSNFLEVPPGEGWSYDFDPRHLGLIAEAGFDTLRLPLRVGAYWDGQRIDPRFAHLMTDVIERAQAVGLHVIVDLHHYDELMADVEGRADEFVEIWTALSLHFNDHDGLIFELLNEPTEEVQNSQMLPLYARALKAIRVHHPDAWVIYGGADWNSLEQLGSLPKASDPRVVHTFHYYSPFGFTHQQAEWHKDPLPPATWGSDADRVAISKDMARAAGHHTPVFLGEFGVYHRASAMYRKNWLVTVRQEAEAKGIPWCHWGFGAGFGLFDPQTNRWDEDLLETLVDR